MLSRQVGLNFAEVYEVWAHRGEKSDVDWYSAALMTKRQVLSFMLLGDASLESGCDSLSFEPKFVLTGKRKRFCGFFFQTT
jgi:hypothetical protein